MNTTLLATAQWADPTLVSQNYQYQYGEFWLGRAVDNNSIPLGYIDDRHICLVSGSRGGKGTSIIINNLCAYPGSVVVIDPKGENATVTAARRGDGSVHCKGMGQKVLVLDPFDTAQVEEKYKAHFNPLDALDPNNEEVIDEAGRIADALVVMNPESKDPFWEESARQMIKGLILHVLSDEMFDGRRNLVTVRDLITLGYNQTFEHLKAKGLTGISSQSLMWEAVKQNNSFYTILSGIGESFASMATNSPKQFESVLQTANRNTEFIDSPAMRRCLSSSDFQLSDLKTDPRGVSLYLSLPQRYMNTHYRWLRMMISLITTEMEKVKGTPATGHRILMCLDEFAGLKRMEVIENAIAQIAGFGVTIFFILQSLEQLKATYKDNWETFLSNSGLKIFFNLEDYFTREYVSKFIGETELIRETRSSSRSESESYSTSRSESYNKSNSYSQSTSQSGGKNTSRNRSTGSSDGMSWKRKLFFFRGNKNYNEGNNSSQGSSDGSNSGWSNSSNRGGSTGYGTSTAETYGTSKSFTEGTNESIHKRQLVTPDELGKMFGRINDKYHLAYPGLALVLVSGENPFPVQRTNYFQDPLFYKLFNPHPDFDNSSYEILMLPPDEELLDYISTSSNLEFSVCNGTNMNEGNSYMKLGVNDNFKNFSMLSRPFLRMGKTINNVLPIEVSRSNSSHLFLDTPVGGHLAQIDERRAIIKTPYPKVNYEIEERNQEKIKNQTLAQQNKYRIATILALLSTVALIIVALIGAIQVPLFLTFNISFWSIPYYILGIIWEELKLDGLAWLVFGIVYLIANILLFFILLALTELLFKLPRKMFAIAYDLSQNIYTCPLPNPTFDEFDRKLKNIFENRLSKWILARKPKFFLPKVIKFISKI